MITFDPDALESRRADLERETLAEGFWDDQRRAARTSSELHRTQGKLDTYERLSSEAAELDTMLEMAAEDADWRGELERALASLDRDMRKLQEEALFTGEYDSGPAVVGVHAGAGGTDSQDWAEILLRMYLRWAEARGLKSRSSRGDPGGGGGAEERHVHAHRRERLRDHAGREGRAPAGAPLAVRLRPQAAHLVRPGRGLAVRRRRRRRRDRRGRSPHRHVPLPGRRRPARQQDGLGRAAHPPPHGDRRAVPERALTAPEQGAGDADPEVAAARARARGARGGGSPRSAARPRTSRSDRRSARTCCTPTRW